MIKGLLSRADTARHAIARRLSGPCPHCEARNREAVQRAALEHANAVRRARTRVLIQIRALPSPDGRRQVARMLRTDDRPHELDGMLLTRLLSSIHRMGPTRSEQTLVECSIALTKKLGAATERQRHALADALDPDHAATGLRGTAAQERP